MATISELIISIGADPSRLRTGLNKSNAMLAQFAATASIITKKGLTDTVSNVDLFHGMDTKATRAANAIVGALRKEFASKIGLARTQLETGLINIHQYDVLGKQAAENFNAGVVAGLKKLQTDKIANPATRAALVAQFKDTGSLAAIAFEKSLLIGIRQVGQAVRRVGKEMTASISLPLLAVGAASLKAADSFNRGMANIGALIPQNSKLVLQLKDDILGLSKSTGTSAGDLTKGVYQLISAYGGASPLVKELAIAIQAAGGGAATTSDAILLLSAVTKGFGDASLEAQQHAADLATKTVALGQTTFPELAANMGEVVPVAARLGLSMEELFATFATASGVTGNTSQVATQLKGVVEGLSNPTKQLSAYLHNIGFTSSEAAIKALGFQRVLVGISESAKATGTPIAKYIGSIEGQTLAVALANAQAKDFADNVQKLTNVQGAAAEAYKAQTTGVGAAAHSFDVAKANAIALAIQIGDRLAPTFIKLLDASQPFFDFIGNIAEGFGTLPGPVQGFIVSLLGAVVVIGPLLTIFGTMVTTFSSVGRAALYLRTTGIAMGVLKTAMIGVTGTGLLWVTGIGAVIAIIYLLRHRIDDAGKVIDDFFAKISAGIKKIPIIGGALSAVLNFATLAPKAKTSGEKTAEGFIAGAVATVTAGAKKITGALSRVLTPPEGSDKPLDLGGGGSGTKDPFAKLRREADEFTKRLEYMNTLPGTIPDRFARTVPVLQQIQRELDHVNALIKQAGGPLKAPGALLDIQSGLQGDLGPKAFTGITTAVDEVMAGMKDAFRDGEDLTKGAVRYAIAVDRARQMYWDISKILEADGGKLANNKTLLEEQARLFKQLPDRGAPLDLTPKAELPSTALLFYRLPALTNDLTLAALDYQKASVDFELISQSGTNSEIASAQRNLNLYQKALITVRANVAKAILKQPVEFRGFQLQGVKDILSSVGINLDGGKHKADRFRIALQAIGRSAVGLANVANSIGLIGDAGAKSIGAVVSLVDSIDALGHVTDNLGNVDVGKLASGIVGAIGAGLQILSSLFGGDSEGKAIRKANNDRLAELNQNLKLFTSSIGNTLKAQSAVARLIADPQARQAIAFDRSGLGNDQSRALITGVLARYGVTLQQIEAIAKANGIELLDKNGHIVAGTMEQLNRALGPVIFNLTHFSKSLEDQQAKIALHNKVFGITETPQQTFTDQLSLLQQFAPKLASRFAGLSATDTTGQDQIRKVIQGIVLALEGGKLAPDLFGGLENWQALAGILTTVVDSFDQLNSSVLDSLNVPNGFKVAAAEFAAQIVGLGPNANRPIVPLPPDTITPIIPGKPPKLNADGTLINYYITIPYGGVVVQAGTKDANLLADEVVQGIRQKVRRQTGDTLDIGAVR